MPISTPRKQSSREKVARHRARKKAEGMRAITIWAPDTRTVAFKAEARRQAKLIAKADLRDPGLNAFLDLAFDDLVEDIAAAERRKTKS